jgi:hypothetical protein
MSGSESKGLSPSFAENIVDEVIKPSYKYQLQKGIEDQSTWKKWSNTLDISSHFFSAGATFIAAYSIYSGNSICQYITVALTVLTQLSKGLSSYSSSEEMKTSQNNTAITSQILGAISSGNNNDPESSNVGNVVENSNVGNVVENSNVADSNV